MNIPLSGAALNNQLTGEQPETGQIVSVVSEDRQMAKEEDDGVIFAETSQVIINLK